MSRRRCWTLLWLCPYTPEGYAKRFQCPGSREPFGAHQRLFEVYSSGVPCPGGRHSRLPGYDGAEPRGTSVPTSGVRELLMWEFVPFKLPDRERAGEEVFAVAALLSWRLWARYLPEVKTFGRIAALEPSLSFAEGGIRSCSSLLDVLREASCRNCHPNRILVLLCRHPIYKTFGAKAS